VSYGVVSGIGQANEVPFIRMIHREAESEGISITEVVDRAFRAYFARGA
jgi:hypothetical protein